MANTVVGPTYITGTQLAVVETLLVGLRKKCISDFYATYIEGYLKGNFSFWSHFFSCFHFNCALSPRALWLRLSPISSPLLYPSTSLLALFLPSTVDSYSFTVECTRILLESGYSTLEFYDPASHTATLLSLPDSSARPEATPTVPVGSDVHDKSERDVITHKPFVHFELRCFSEVGTTSVNNEDLEHGMDRLLVSSINVLVSTSNTTLFSLHLETYLLLSSFHLFLLFSCYRLSPAARKYTRVIKNDSLFY